MQRFVISAHLFPPLVALACNVGPRDEGFGVGTGGVADGGAAKDDDDDDAPGPAGETDPDEESGGQLFDVGTHTDLNPQADEGCNKVDFLFVIDNSSSMLLPQENVIGSFPGFIDAIQAHEQTEDFHVMVVDSDATQGSCQNICNPPQGEEGICEGYTCGAIFGIDCGLTLGAGQYHPVGGGASNRDCGLPPGQKWMDATQPDVDGTFECIAQVGTWGDSDERPGGALVAALTTEASPGGCNEGFLRNDAILVVTMVTNANLSTATEYSADDIHTWYDAVVDAKGGNEEAIVMISFSAVSDTYMDKYAELTALFGERGFIAGLDLPDYSVVFDSAIATIEQVCDEFEPEG